MTTASPQGATVVRSGTGPRIALLSTSDTDLLSGRASHANFAMANPSRLDVESELPAVISGADVVIVRILGTAPLSPTLKPWRNSKRSV